MPVRGTIDSKRNAAGIPTVWTDNKPLYDYHSGWIGSDGTLYAVESHSNLKAPGFTTGNREYQKHERARRRAQGRPWRAPWFSPGNKSTYHHAWDKGFLRLTVKRGEVKAEYNSYRSGGLPNRPNLCQVFNPRQAASLVRLCQAMKASLLLQTGDRDGYHHVRIPHRRLHSADDILTEVPR